MTNLQRIISFILSLFMIACGIVLLLDPKDGLLVVAIVLSISLLLYGVRKLVYYFRMARHMTGGLSILFIAVIAIDISIFAVAVIDSRPQLAIVMFLVCYNLLNGILLIARGVESKLFGSPWVLKVVLGLLSMSIASLCASSVNSGETLIWVICIGLFFSAAVRLIEAFKPPEIIYIQ